MPASPLRLLAAEAVTARTVIAAAVILTALILSAVIVVITAPKAVTQSFASAKS